MSRLSVLVVPDSRLKRHAEPVARVDDGVRRLMDGMLEAMHEARGIGLAAPQVGVLKRVIVADVSRPDEDPRAYRMANPEILWRSEDEVSGEEGCLSVPEQYGDVTRPARIKVRYLDYQNEIREMEADGLLARCIQHEADHLEGVLFVDYLSLLKRNIILRKLAKAKKQTAAV